MIKNYNSQNYDENDDDLKSDLTQINEEIFPSNMQNQLTLAKDDFLQSNRLTRDWGHLDKEAETKSSEGQNLKTEKKGGSKVENFSLEPLKFIDSSYINSVKAQNAKSKLA
jgi:hypothetical protein